MPHTKVVQLSSLTLTTNEILATKWGLQRRECIRCGLKHGVIEVGLCTKGSCLASVTYSYVIVRVTRQLRYRLRKKRVCIDMPKKVQAKVEMVKEVLTFTSKDIDKWNDLFHNKYCALLRDWHILEYKYSQRFKFNLNPFAKQRRVLRGLTHPPDRKV